MKYHEQLLKDMKASAPKTAMLGFLLLIGLYFWVPPLLRAFSGSAPTNEVITTTSTPATTGASVGIEPNNSSSTSNKQPRDSAAMTRLLKESPLLQSANMDEFPPRPFGIDADQFPLPVLFADESEAEAPKEIIVEAPPPVEKLTGLVLKSTIVGARRRAALINDRLFQEGQSVPWNGQQLKLSAVLRKSVTLTDGSHEWQLVLDDARREEGSMPGK